jgi:DNA-directed RNA polymerase subunit beta
MPFLPDGTPVDIILNPIGVPSRMNLGQVLETHLGWAAQILGFRMLTPVFDGADDAAIEDALARAWLAQKAGAINPNPSNENTAMSLELAKTWLKNCGYDGDRAFSDDYPGEAKEICLRLWLEDMGIPSRNLNPQEVEQAVERVNSEYNLPPPTLGKVILHDGRTGEQFDQPVTVGNIYMMKLIHLVEDKVHARSTGPYSLITQQPLGGKAQFGGQRFGEMEVWALEAYGSAYNLQEFLTIKSDDVTGRAKSYEAIVKNEEILQSGVPESFKVLVKELQSLGLAIEVINEEEEEMTLARETTKVPKLETELQIVEGSPVEGLTVEDSTVEDSTVEGLTVEDSSVENSTVEDSTVEDSTVENSTVENSTVEDSTVEDSTVEGLTVEDSTVEDSTVEDSTVEGLTVEDSTVEGLTVEDSTVEGLTVEDSTVEDSTVENSTVEDSTVEDSDLTWGEAKENA